MIPLSRAVLCTSCETISETNGACPACGSNALGSLAGWLGVLGAEEGRTRPYEPLQRFTVGHRSSYSQSSKDISRRKVVEFWR